MRLAGFMVLAVTLLLRSTVAHAGVSVHEASNEQWRGAQKTFEIADELYDSRKYAEALTAYRASYDIVASPNSRLMIARSLRELGDLTGAHAEFLRTLNEAKEAALRDDKYGDTARAADGELAALRAQTARLSLVLEASMKDAIVSVDTRELQRHELAVELVLKPGRHAISARAPDGRSTRVEAELRAGEHRKLVLGAPLASRTAQAPTPRAGGGTARTLAWVAAGVGVAGTATFATFGLLNNSVHADLEAACPGNRCPPERESDIETGRRYKTLANIGLGVGIVGLAASATLFLLGSSDDTELASFPGVEFTADTANIEWQGSF